MPRPRKYAVTMAALRVAMALSLAVAVWPAGARAQASGDDRGERDRIVWMQARFDDGDGPSALWWYGWLGVGAAIAVGSGVAAALVDDSDVRALLVVGAAQGLLGAITQLFFPLPSIWAADELRAMPESTPEERAAKRVRAEELLRRSAKAEAGGVSWLTHLGGLGLAITGGLILWLGYERLDLGLIDFGATLAVGELSIWTQPTGAVDDEEEYRAR